MFEIDFHLYLLIVFFGVLVATDGQQMYKTNHSLDNQNDYDSGYKCSDIRLVSEIWTKLGKCLRDKWGHPPRNPNDWDIRTCCYFYEDNCVWNKLIKERCRVTEVFTKEISKVYENCRQDCINQGIVYTEDLCHSQPTNYLKDSLCGRYMPCSMSDPIPSPLPDHQLDSKDTNDSNTIVFEFEILFLSFVLIHSLNLFFY